MSKLNVNLNFDSCPQSNGGELEVNNGVEYLIETGWVDKYDLNLFSMFNSIAYI